jgi:hypothetical protein
MVVTLFGGFERLSKCFLQIPFAERPEKCTEEPSLRFLPSRTMTTSISVLRGLSREGVGVARRSAPQIGVGCRKHDVVRIGPVVVESLPDATRTLRDISVVCAFAMNPSNTRRHYPKQFPASWPKVGEAGDELLRRCCSS